jgi:hypothetical protein
MIGRRIVEVHRALGETKPQNSGVKIDVLLRIAGNSGDVMDTAKFHALGD